MEYQPVVAPATTPAMPGDTERVPATLSEAYDMALRLEAAGDDEGALYVLRSSRERYESAIRLITPARGH